MTFAAQTQAELEKSLPDSQTGGWDWDSIITPGALPWGFWEWEKVGTEWLVGASQVALVVKNPPANAGDTGDLGSVPGQEDPLEEGTATHSGILS